MTGLGGVTPAASYPFLLQIPGGLSTTLTGVQDGAGSATPLSLSTTGFTLNPSTPSTIDGTDIGQTVRGKGSFTTLGASGGVALSPANAGVTLSPTGTGTVVIGPATAGTIDAMAIGNTTRASGKFTTLDASGQITSSLATGSAPLSVASTTRVANLNVASAGTADTVTTNANLTGPIASSGNATSIASQTGTGTTFVMSASPAITGTGSFAGNTVTANTSVTAPTVTTASGALTLTTGNAANIQITPGSNILQATGASGIFFNLRDSAVAVDAGGLWRFQTQGGLFRFQANTAAAGNFSTGSTPFALNNDGEVYFGGDNSGNTLHVNPWSSGNGFNVTPGTNPTMGTSGGAFILQGGSTTAIQATAGAVAFPNVSTTASAANAFLDNAASNNLLRSTSSRKYKAGFTPLGLDEIRGIAKAITPGRYFSCAAADDPRELHFGVLAEDLAPACRPLIGFDRNGDPDWVKYDRVGILAFPLINDLESRIAAVERRLAA